MQDFGCYSYRRELGIVSFLYGEGDVSTFVHEPFDSHMATFAEDTYDGSPVRMSAPRRERPDRGQYRSQRNAIWLAALEVGLPGMLDGRLHPVSVADLAALWGRVPQTILNGVASARADRKLTRSLNE
jgi:hypothetical protein